MATIPINYEAIYENGEGVSSIFRDVFVLMVGLNLNDKNLVYENKTNYDFNEKGVYQIYGEYKSLSGDVIISEKKSFDYQ